MSNVELGRHPIAKRNKSQLKKENVGFMQPRRNTMDGTQQITQARPADFKVKANSSRSEVPPSSQRRRAFKDIVNVDRTLRNSVGKAKKSVVSGSHHATFRRSPDITGRPTTPTPAGSPSIVEITDLFSRLSFVDPQKPEIHETSVSNEASTNICLFCSASQEESVGDQTCQCHRYSRVFDQSSGLLNDSQSTPIRDQDPSIEEPPWMFMETQTQTQTQTQTRNCTMSMAALQETLKSIVISPCISEEEDVDVSYLSPARISLLPPLARSISLGYIPRAFPQEVVETIAATMPAP